MSIHWQRLRRSLARRYRELRLPRGYVRLGTRHGGWWVDAHAIGADPLLVDCGLGMDLSFPAAFLARFGGRVVGVEAHPDSVAWCERHRPAAMEIWPRAFWREAGLRLRFHLPRARSDLPPGADGISGSLLASHGYAGGGTVEVRTTSLAEVLEAVGRAECDVLKLDIEGAEYEVLADLCARGEIRRAGQVLVEFHHGWTEYSPQHTAAACEALQRRGFALVHVEGRNHAFRRADLGRG